MSSATCNQHSAIRHAQTSVFDPEAQAGRERHRSVIAFTLVELLVVVTIIVLLLALLTPAMDKAIYQAELTVCGAGLRAHGGASLQYAMDHRRYYPFRRGVEEGSVRSSWLRQHRLLTEPNFDDRPTIASYMSANKFFNCSMVKAVDFESPPATEPYILTASYSYWYGWRFGPANSVKKAMKRVGDRFEWSEPGSGRVRRFATLASDLDAFSLNTFVHSAHPDGDGRLTNVVIQEQQVTSSFGSYKIRQSFWTVSGANAGRGKIDTNYVSDDASVQRLDGLEIDDSRVVRVPYWSTHANSDGERTWLPATD